MNKTELKVKTTAMVGAPDRKVPEPIRRALAEAVRTLEEIHEAHLAEVHIPGMIEPATLTLVIVIDPETEESDVLRKIDQALQAANSGAAEFDLGVWPLHPDDEALPAIRSIASTINADD